MGLFVGCRIRLRSPRIQQTQAWTAAVTQEEEAVGKDRPLHCWTLSQRILPAGPKAAYLRHAPPVNMQAYECIVVSVSFGMANLSGLHTLCCSPSQAVAWSSIQHYSFEVTSSKDQRGGRERYSSIPSPFVYLSSNDKKPCREGLLHLYRSQDVACRLISDCFQITSPVCLFLAIAWPRP